MVKLDFSTKIIILRKQSARNCLTFLKQNVPTCQVLPHLLLTGLALLDHLLLVGDNLGGDLLTGQQLECRGAL